MPSTTVRAHFYQGAVRTEDEVRGLASWLHQLDTTREVVELPSGVHLVLATERNQGRSLGYVGELRMDGIPNACDLEGIERELLLNDDEGLLEKNYFRYYDDYELLIWQRTLRARSPASLAAALSHLLNRTVGFYPVIRPQAFQRLMSAQNLVKALNVSIARPTNPDALGNINPFSSQILDLLAHAEGQSLQLRISANSRGQRGNTLANRVKRGLGQLADMDGVSSARATLELANGEEQDVDLLNDRLEFVERVTYDGRHPTARAMYTLLHSARRDNADQLEALFQDGLAELNKKLVGARARWRPSLGGCVSHTGGEMGYAGQYQCAHKYQCHASRLRSRCNRYSYHVDQHAPCKESDQDQRLENPHVRACTVCGVSAIGIAHWSGSHVLDRGANA